MTRALSTGFPVAIEQDLNWYVPPKGGRPRVVVGHGGELTGRESDLESYFFDQVRPMMEAALRNPDRSKWPLITLNLDFKTEEPDLLHAVWELLQEHRDWLTTAEKSANEGVVQSLTPGPMLVLNGPSDAQQKVYYDDVPVGSKLLTFGAVHTNMQDSGADPTVIETESASNYRRWWNNPWSVIEPASQSKAGVWTAVGRRRLWSFVNHAHQQGLWIRFYTLDGATQQELSQHGWFQQYNFGDLKKAEDRWMSAVAIGVDYIASDQYELLGDLIASYRKDKQIDSERK